MALAAPLLVVLTTSDALLPSAFSVAMNNDFEKLVGISLFNIKLPSELVTTASE